MKNSLFWTEPYHPLAGQWTAVIANWSFSGDVDFPERIGLEQC